MAVVRVNPTTPSPRIFPRRGRGVFLRSAKGRTRRGIELIETALILPLVLLLVFGILEFGWMFLLLQQVTHGARAGARIAVRADATNANVVSAVQDMMTDRGIEGLEPVEILPGGDVSDLDSGTVVTVTVKVRYADVGLNVPLLAAFAPTFLQASVSMAKEGPS